MWVQEESPGAGDKGSLPGVYSHFVICSTHYTPWVGGNVEPSVMRASWLTESIINGNVTILVRPAVTQVSLIGNLLIPFKRNVGVFKAHALVFKSQGSSRLAS